MNESASLSNPLPSLALLAGAEAPVLHEAEIQPRWDRAIVALLSEPNLSQAASRAGVSQTTMWRWLQEPDFARRYRQAQRQVMQHCVGRLQTSASDAAAVLHEIATNPATPASARVAAARSILELATKASEVDLVTECVADLEHGLAEMRRTAEDARVQAQEARQGGTR